MTSKTTSKQKPKATTGTSSIYVAPRYGDIDQDPDHTDLWYSFYSDDEDDLDANQLANILARNQRIQNIFRKTDSLTDFLSFEDEETDFPGEYTTKDKIIQTQNGSAAKNCLKGKQDFTKGIDERAVEETRIMVHSNYRKLSDGSIEVYNEDLLRRQKQVLGFLVKQFGSALFSGKSITRISLPVTIFEPQSNLEREAAALGYAPYYLSKAAAMKNPADQFKLAVAYYIASLHLGTNPQKPFNPILGETFQGILGGCPVYFEQISHHPPVSAFQMFGKDFRMEGQTEFTAAISMNSVKSWKIGYLKVIFKNTNTTIWAQYPAGLMSGTAFGRRTFQFTDKFLIFDLVNKYYAEIDFDVAGGSFFSKAKETKDHFNGTIWKVNDKFNEELRQASKRLNEMASVSFKEAEHAVSKVDTVDGSWMEYLKIGGKDYWKFGEPWPHKMVYWDNPLASDSNFRLDVLYLRAGDEEKSQKLKEVMEDIQRKDRKLREQTKKEH